MSSIESDSEDLESVEGGGEEEEGGGGGRKWQAEAVRKRQGGEVVVVGYAGDVSSADGLRGAADQTFMLLCHGGEEAAARGT